MSSPGLKCGLRILEIVDEEGAVGFNSLKTRLSLGASSLTRYLNILLEEGYLDKTPELKYTLGPKALRFSSAPQQPPVWQNLIVPLLEQIVGRSPLTAVWFTFEYGKMICKDKVISPSGIAMQEIGSVRTDYILHPWGYLLLADCSEKQRDFLMRNGLVKMTRDIALPSPKQQQRWLEMAMRLHYVDDEASVYPNVRRVAFPVRSGAGRLLGAIAVGGIKDNMTETSLQELIRFIQSEIQLIGAAE